MSNGFYQLNNDILKYNRVKGNTEKEFKKNILYLVMCSNENYQRLKSIREPGEVEISVNTLIDDVYKYTAGTMKLNNRNVSDYLKELEESGIISLVFKSKSKGKPSIYKVESVTVSVTDSVTVNVTDKPSNTNGLNTVSVTDSVTDSVTVSVTTKKELEKELKKELIKTTTKKGVGELSTEEYNKCLALKEQYHCNKKDVSQFNTNKIINQIKDLLKIYSYEQIENIIEYSNNNFFSNPTYMSNFFTEDTFKTLSNKVCTVSKVIHYGFDGDPNYETVNLLNEFNITENNIELTRGYYEQLLKEYDREEIKQAIEQTINFKKVMDWEIDVKREIKQRLPRESKKKFSKSNDLLNYA